MEEVNPQRITDSKKGRVNESSAILFPSFQDDPLMNWFLHTTPEAKRLAHLKVFLHAVVKASVVSHGHILEAGNWGSTAVFCPPTHLPDDATSIIRAGLIPVMIKLGISSCKRVLLDYGNACKRLKAQGMSVTEMKKGYWYVVIMGTHADKQGQGLGSILLQQMQKQAAPHGRPIWLEATTERSMKLYAKLGFEMVGDVKLGNGRVGANGCASIGGEGITIWGMVWRP